jgi:NADPH-dependent ferric siderophore reductase
VKRGWEGLVIKAFGGRDFRLTVLGSEPVNDHYHRLHLDDGGLLESCGVHPTMWVRLWFDHDGKPHQRAYTLVDPDPVAGRFSLEFAVHDGPAPRWATAATVGDTIEATVQGSGFTLPDPPPRHLYAIGDAASVPAINSLLDAAEQVPATVWLEYAHDAETALPLRNRAHHTISWVARENEGRHLVETVCAELPSDQDALYWVGAEASSARAIGKHIRRDLAVDKHRLSALGYWHAT